MGPLEGSYVKLDRARVHAEDLNQRLEVALDPAREFFVRESDGDPSKYVYRVDRLPVVEPEWSAILGDFLTNARASLDYLAHDLVELDNGTATKNTCFPILDPPVNNSQPKAAGIVGVTSPSILDAVESVQPHGDKRWHGVASANPLYLLNKLVNIDKHRLLLAVDVTLNHDGMSWDLPDGGEGPTYRFNLEPLNHGDPVAWFDFAGREADAEFDPHLTLHVRFDPATGLRGLLGVPAVMELIYNWVRNQVIAHHFASLLGVRRAYDYL